MEGIQGSPLFQDSVFAIVLSRDLTRSLAEGLSATIEDHSGEVQGIGQEVNFEDVTHIVSTTIDFKQYNLARLHMIPVLTPSWVTESLMRGKTAALRPFTPDPNLIFSNVNLTCADIPDGDKEAIIGTVLAMGGMESNSLGKLTTHLCALTIDDPKVQQAIERNHKCRVVLPHWFDDCFRLGKRIDEKPYLLPDPEILRVNPEEYLAMPSSDRIIGASELNPKELQHNQIPRELDVFKGKKVMISEDFKLSDKSRHIIEHRVEDGGGTITNNVRDASIFVCKWRDGKDYLYASRAGIDVGNLSWLYYLITHNEWTSPLRRLLHYPFPRNGIPGFEKTRITLSNYGGEARTYLENLVIVAGGEFTKSMKQDNTHLITGRQNSEKCDAAREWNVHMISHLWLEESYAKCEAQSVSNPRYNHFPPRTNLGEIIGTTQFNQTTLERLYFPPDPTVSPQKARTKKRKVMHEKDRNASKDSSSPDDTHVSIAGPSRTPQSAPPQRRTKSTPQTDLRTPAPNRRASAGKENETPSTTGSRGAKERAVSRIHGLATDIALYEKEKKRKGNVWGGDRAASKIEQERLLERSSSPASKPGAEEEFSEEEVEAEVKQPKRAKTSALPPVEVRLMITGYKEWAVSVAKEDSDKKKLREIGVLVVQDPNTCTHLAAPAMVRTQKFLCALAHGPVIVSTDFIEACVKKGKIPDINKFLLKDQENEQKFNVKLKDVLARAKINKRSLLRRVPIYCTQEIPNGPDTYRSIVEANGGTFAIYRGKPVIKKVSPEEDIGPAEPVYLVTGQRPEEKRLWPKFVEMAEAGNMIPRIVSTEWILTVAMSQKQEWDEYFTATGA